jgi:hypothetical protein
MSFLKRKTALAFFCCHILTLIPVLCQQVSSAKVHTGDRFSDGSIHALGNGKMLVYEKGPDIINIYPYPFSSPSLYRFELNLEKGENVLSSREQGTAIWTHSIFNGDRKIGQVTDAADTGLPCLLRHLDLQEPLSFRLKTGQAVNTIGSPEAANGIGRLLLLVPAGTLFYQKYAYPKPLYHLVAWKGNIKVTAVPDHDGEYFVSVGKGLSDILLCGGPEYSEVIENSEAAQKLTSSEIIGRARTWWKDFTARRTDFEDRLPAELPLRQKLLGIIDDVSVMIRVQQAEAGAVIAGYPYPLGYVRDQYGVSRGLLALGYTGEAKKILEFYWKCWKKNGVIHNAQGIGLDGIFHIHENDEVEIPGYLMVQAFDYLARTGDAAFIETIFPMLEWCWTVQVRNLAGWMLPFNGDETYVAGGILPRSVLNDGSAEATMLFINGGEKFIDWIKKHREWPGSKILEGEQVLDSTVNHFRRNFWVRGQLITNNPDRLNFIAPPRFRHGVCERSGPDCIISGKGGFGGIDWTERDANGRYQCPACLSLGPLPKSDKVRYNLISVSLTPLYMGSSLFRSEELKPIVEKIYSSFITTGILSSAVDSTGSPSSRISVGYDYGFLLNAMLETGIKNTQPVYEKAISVTDSTGVWSEYYDNNQPRGTRYRPWESAINIEALLKFAMHYPDR